MGVTETSPPRPTERRRGNVQNKLESSSRSPRTGPGLGLDAQLHLLEMRRTQMNAKYVRVAPPRPAGILPMSAETNTPLTGRPYEKTLQEHPRTCKASGARPAGPLARPHGIAPATRREESPISNRQHLRDPNGYTRRCSGATVGDGHKGPLNN
jgi:hypothetical protein